MLRSRCLPPSPRSAPSSKAFPALCPCEPRLPPGEMQPVPYGARSNTRLLPAFASQPPPAGIRSVRKYLPGYVFLFKYKRSLHSDTSRYPAKGKKKHTGSTTPTDAFAPALMSGRPRDGRAQAGAPLSAPICSRTHVEIRGRNGPGRRAPKPHTNPIHVYVYTAATTAVCCCYCCCCAAAAEVSLVRAVAASTAAVLLLRLVE